LHESPLKRKISSSILGKEARLRGKNKSEIGKVLKGKVGRYLYRSHDAAAKIFSWFSGGNQGGNAQNLTGNTHRKLRRWKYCHEGLGRNFVGDSAGGAFFGLSLQLVQVGRYKAPREEE